MKWTITDADAELIWDSLLRRANDVAREARDPAVRAAGLAAERVEHARRLANLAARFDPEWRVATGTETRLDTD